MAGRPTRSRAPKGAEEPQPPLAVVGSLAGVTGPAIVGPRGTLLVSTHIDDRYGVQCLDRSGVTVWQRRGKLDFVGATGGGDVVVNRWTGGAGSAADPGRSRVEVL